MTVNLESHAIILSGKCGVEDVEILVEHLESRPDLAVELGSAVEIHTALWQALMFFKPKIIGSPMSLLVAEKILPALTRDRDETGQASPG